MAILRDDEFRFQWDHPRVSRCDNDRGDDSMGIGHDTVMLCGVALITVDVFGREVLRPIERQQQISVERAIGVKMPRFMECIDGIGKEREYGFGWNGVEQVTDLVVAWNIQHAEQALDIAAALRCLQGALEIKERRALGEKDRECPHGGIRHGVEQVVAGALIRKLFNGRAKRLDKIVEGKGS